MMKTKIWTKSLAGVCAAVTAVPVLAMSASAATYEPVAVTGCKVVRWAMTAWQRQATESLQSPLWQIIWAALP